MYIQEAVKKAVEIDGYIFDENDDFPVFIKPTNGYGLCILCLTPSDIDRAIEKVNYLADRIKELNTYVNELSSALKDIKIKINMEVR